MLDTGGYSYRPSLFLAAIIAAVGLCSSGSQMQRVPLSAIESKVDELGALPRIQSEADAQTYVQALANRFEFDKNALPHAEDFKSRLARAEYLALSDSTKRIQEDAVTRSFNNLMEDWKTQTGLVSITMVNCTRFGFSCR